MIARFAPLWIVPDQVFDGDSFVENVALITENGLVVGMEPVQSAPNGAAVVRLQGTVTPGYIDLQVNGGGDVLLNADPSPQGMRRIAAAHRGFGTVGLLPTLITDAPQVLAAAVASALVVKGEIGLLGLHIEGPHIAIARRGTHAARYIRPLDRVTMDQVAQLRAAGIAVMITLAPEAATPDQVRELAQTGAIVSIGHSDASADEVRLMLDAGARCFTHLFNAMSPMLNRSPGVTGACINSTAHAGIICDGIHVADEMVGLSIRARPIGGRTFLVSDAMPTVGGSDHFSLYGQDITLVDGRLVNAEGSLAGAHVTQGESVARLINRVGIAPEVALAMATSVPADLIGRPDLGRIVGRGTQDILVLNADWSVNGTLQDGLISA